MTREQLKLKIQQASQKKELLGNQNSMIPNLPNSVQLTKNFGKSVIRNIQSVMQGNNLNVSEEEKQKRLNICNSCEFFIKESQRCSKCGCYMAVKTYLKAEKCPVGKW
jgi:hypothetical protein